MSEVSNDKWARNLLAGIFLTLAGGLVTVGVPGLYQLGSMRAELEGVSGEVKSLSDRLDSVISHDINGVRSEIRDIRTRIDAGILPQAAERIADLEKRIRELEKNG